jgi:hypothetical protein
MPLASVCSVPRAVEVVDEQGDVPLLREEAGDVAVGARVLLRQPHAAVQQEDGRVPARPVGREVLHPDGLADDDEGAGGRLGLRPGRPCQAGEDRQRRQGPAEQGMPAGERPGLWAAEHAANSWVLRADPGRALPALPYPLTQQTRAEDHGRAVEIESSDRRGQRFQGAGPFGPDVQGAHERRPGPLAKHLQRPAARAR